MTNSPQGFHPVPAPSVATTIGSRLQNDKLLSRDEIEASWLKQRRDLGWFGRWFDRRIRISQACKSEHDIPPPMSLDQIRPDITPSIREEMK